MGAAVHPAVGFVGSAVVGAVTLGAWCVFGALVVVAGTGVVLIVIAGGALMLADWVTDTAVGLVRTVLRGSGAVYGDVLEPEVQA